MYLLKVFFVSTVSLFILVSCSTLDSRTSDKPKRSLASVGCPSPSPIFGKVVATCGKQMITFVGNEKINILGVLSTTAKFELAYCLNGGGRKPLNIETNSEGYKFTYIDPNKKPKEQYEISNMWGKFEMTGVGSDGGNIKTSCQPYKDTRANIKYIDKEIPSHGVSLPKNENR